MSILKANEGSLLKKKEGKTRKDFIVAGTWFAAATAPPPPPKKPNPVWIGSSGSELKAQNESAVYINNYCKTEKSPVIFYWFYDKFFFS